MPSTERVKQLYGWNFLQFARAARYYELSRSPLPPATIGGLEVVQRHYLTNHAIGPQPLLTGIAADYAYLWTCEAFAWSVDYLQQNGKLKKEGQ